MADYQGKSAKDLRSSITEERVRFFESFSSQMTLPPTKTGVEVKLPTVKSSSERIQLLESSSSEDDVEAEIVQKFSEEVDKFISADEEIDDKPQVTDVSVEFDEIVPQFPINPPPRAESREKVFDSEAFDSQKGGMSKKSNAGAEKGESKGAKSKINTYEHFSQCEPTVFDAPDFDPVADAQALRKAMKGWGTDESTILDIITRRSNLQRQEIHRAFKKEFGRDLIDDLKKELGGDFEDVIVGLMLPTPEYCAQQMRKAMKGAGTDEDCLIEIICTKTNAEMQVIVDVYNSMYETTLDDRIRSELSGDLQRLLTLAITGEWDFCCARDEETFEPEKAREQAEALYNAGEAKLGTDEETFVIMLGHLGRRQLAAVFEEYKAISGKTIEQAIECEFGGDLKTAILAIIRCVQNRPRYFAERLHKAMEGAGTDDNTLIRILVSRCEIDLGNIKKEYECLYGCTLLSAVKDSSETSGDYKRALCAIIGNA